MKQVLIIHWGDKFRTKKDFYEKLKVRSYNPLEKSKPRREWIAEQLTKTHQTMVPTMPNKFNADYIAWKIWFERHFPFFNNEELSLVGYSLWGIFLVKYLSENKFPKKIKQLHLVAAVIEHKKEDENILGNFKIKINKIKNVLPQVESIFIYHSKDDPAVPFSHAERYKKYLPWAKLIEFENRWHFRQETFPELLENIKNN